MARIYLIGAGVIAQWHATATKKLSDVSEIHVFDPNPVAVGQFAGRFPGAHAHDSVDAMLSSSASDGDIVVVATPPFAHFDLSMKALQSGRHVLCEKPLAMTLEEATKMLQCARVNRRTIGCCSSRFSGLAASLRARELMNSGQLGEPYHVRWINRWRRARPGIEYQPESAWFLDPARGGGGVLMDWGPYDFAALCELMCPTRVEMTSGFAAAPQTEVDRQDISPPVEQHAAASMVFLSGEGKRIQVTYERAACTHGEEGSACEIELTRGAIRWDWRGGGKLWITRDKQGKAETEMSEHPDLPELHPHERPLVYFEKHLRGGASHAIVNEQAVFNFSCTRAIYEVIRTGIRQVVQLRS